MRTNRTTLIGLASMAVLTAGLVGFAVVHAEPPQVPDAYVPPTLFPAQSQQSKPALHMVAAGSKVLIIGDSYTVGFGADSSDHGYAQMLTAAYGWDARIEGVGGTGYTWGGGPDGKAGQDFLTRLSADTADPSLKPVLVLIEGSQNDYRVDQDTIENAVAKAVATTRKAWPSAQIVLLGPVAPQPLGDTLGPIDDAVRAAASSAGVPFVDGLAAGWFTADNSKQYAFTDGAHPNTAGHAYLAAQTKTALDALFAAPK